MVKQARKPAARKPRNNEEDQLQRAVATLLDTSLPRGSVWFHVPNGGKRGKIEAARMKGMGVKPGVADCIILAGGLAIALELKSSKGRLSPKQKEFAADWVNAGGVWMMARSIGEVIEKLAEIGMPLGVRVAA